MVLNIVEAYLRTVVVRTEQDQYIMYILVRYNIEVYTTWWLV